MDRLVESAVDDPKPVPNDDLVTYFRRLDKKFNKMKSRFEEELTNMF